MNFTISALGSADSTIIQSVNLDMLRVREQDAAHGWVLMEMYSSQLHSCITTSCQKMAASKSVDAAYYSNICRRMSAHAQYEI